MQFKPINYGVHNRYTTGSAFECAILCQNINDCHGTSWWSDGGCHLSNKRAKLVHSKSVVAFDCAPARS